MRTIHSTELEFKTYQGDDDRRYLPPHERVILSSPEAVRVEFTSGTVAYYTNRRLHREDGPAVETSDGFREWRRFGVYHRDNGPAMEWPDGRQQWIVNGKTVKFRSPIHPEHNFG